MDAATLGSDAHWTVHGASARTSRAARVIDLSDAVNKTVVVDAPLPPVVAKLVVQVGFGRVLRRHRELRDAPRTVQQQQRGEEAAERAVPVAHGE